MDERTDGQMDEWMDGRRDGRMDGRDLLSRFLVASKMKCACPHKPACMTACASTCAHPHACMYACIHACLCACTHACMCVCIQSVFPFCNWYFFSNFFLFLENSSRVRYRLFVRLIFGFPGIPGWKSESLFVFLPLEFTPYHFFRS